MLPSIVAVTSPQRPGATLAAARRIEMRCGRLKIASAGIDVVIGPEPVVVGRDASCAVVVPDRHVSAVHAELVATERGVRVRDLESRNGTWVGDVSIAEAYLTGATQLAFGAVEATFDATEAKRVNVAQSEHFATLYGSNIVMRQLFAKLEKLAKTDLTVLIQGETGTGKELVAQAIHAESPRKAKPFVVVDCGSIASTLAESILFGHERGSFTGASERRESPFVQAAGGTVFLDELGELPIEIQPKLLRAIAERRVQSVGGNTYKSFDARIVAATRCDLLGMVNTGTFRSDLFFRIAQVRVDVPSLRDRIDDVPGLIEEVLSASGLAPKSAMKRVSRDTLSRLLRHDWPGNVRELKNAVTVALALAEDGEPIDIAAHIGPPATFHAPHYDADSDSVQSTRSPANIPTYHEAKAQALARFERQYFSMMLQECGGSVVEISRRADLQRAHVRRHLKSHGLSPTRRAGGGGGGGAKKKS